MTVRRARQSHAAGWRGLQLVADIEAAHAGPLLALRSALSSISQWTTCARRSGTRDTKTTGNRIQPERQLCGLDLDSDAFLVQPAQL